LQAKLAVGLIVQTSATSKAMRPQRTQARPNKMPSPVLVAGPLTAPKQSRFI